MKRESEAQIAQEIYQAELSLQHLGRAMERSKARYELAKQEWEEDEEAFLKEYRRLRELREEYQKRLK